MINREQLILDNISLVKNIAKHFYSKNVEQEDLIQSGYLGLIYAIDKNKKDYYLYIKRSIWNFIRKSNWNIVSLNTDIYIPDYFEEINSKDIEELLISLLKQKNGILKIWIIRRLFGIPEPFGSCRHVLTLVGKRRSLPIYDKNLWSITDISKKTGLTTKRILEIKKETLEYLREKII